MNISALERRRLENSDLSNKESEAHEVPKKNFRELLQRARPNKNAQGRDLPAKRRFADTNSSSKTHSHQKENQPSVYALSEAHAFVADDTSEITAATGAKTAALSAEIEAAFEKMASCMLVMHASNDVETTLFLDNPHFASSVLFGTQITIREFSTAPKAFNVEIISNPGGVALIDGSKNDLLSAFRDGNFNFTIHRFDTHIEDTSDRPLFHRKEGSGDEQKDQRGGHQQ